MNKIISWSRLHCSASFPLKMPLLFAALSISVLPLHGQTQTGGIDATARLNIKSQPFVIELPNSSTGTTANKLAKAVVVSGVLKAQIITTSAADQAAALGCVISGAGTSGTALIMIAGTGSCYFDGATTAGHIAVPSSTSAGALHDTGSASSPTSGEVMATVGATDACGSPPCLIASNLFMTPDIIATGGNGNGGGNGGGNGAKQQTHNFGASFDGGGSAIAANSIAYFDLPSACTIQATNISVDTGTLTFKVWKIAAGTAIPTVANVINTSGISISSGTHVRSTTVSDFTSTAVTAHDIGAITLTTISGPTKVAITIECQ